MQNGWHVNRKTNLQLNDMQNGWHVKKKNQKYQING